MTLGASARFRDTLAGRKEEVWPTPMTAGFDAHVAKPFDPDQLVRTIHALLAHT